ncbi:MAG TPA: nucleotidyltransferase family protein [Chryseosolibacter sp.]
MNYAAIILAAGSSSRMGRSKQLLEVDGEKLLIRTIRAALETGLKDVVVVIGHHEEIHRKEIDKQPVEIVYNPTWQRGMGNSLKAGLSHLMMNHPSVDAVILLVCDQPHLSGNVLTTLIHRYEETGKPIVASRYSGMPGVPALFDKTFFAKLTAIPDEEGAKKIILRHPSDTVTVEFPGGAVDLDTIEDYNAYQSKGKE